MSKVAEFAFKERWAKVQIYAPTYALPRTCVGYVYCSQERRLLDQLNDVFPGTVPGNTPFLSIREPRIYSLDGGEEVLQFACLNKASILFVREFEVGEPRPRPKGYPYVTKSAISVRLYLPFYTLTGQMHVTRGERASDVLNQPLQFLPLTNVVVSPSVGRGESLGFIAVNKNQLILLEEIEPAEMQEIRRGIEEL